MLKDLKINADYNWRMDNSWARVKLYVGEKYFDLWPGAEGRKPPIPALPWFTDGQKRAKRNKENLFKNSWLNQHSPARTASEAAVWEVIQDFTQLPASQNLTTCMALNVDASFSPAEKNLYFLFGACPPSTMTSGYISMSNSFYWLIHIKPMISILMVPPSNKCFIKVQICSINFFTRTMLIQNEANRSLR